MDKMRFPRAPQLEVLVTEDHIAKALPRDSGHCMIADAVKAAFPWASRISVDLQTIRYSDIDKGFRYTYLTPRSAQVALVKFDQGLKPEPMRFRLRNGQVTRAGGNAVSDKVREKSRLYQQARRAEMKKARLLDEAGPTTVPRIVGGKTPPLAPLARRRSFGLRALER